MARTQQEILIHLVNNAPGFIARDPLGVALLDALALLFATGEQIVESLRALLFRQTASGEWLDEIGAEIGVPRLPGEDDDAYSERLILRARGVTPDGLRAEIDALVARVYGEGYKVQLFEPRVRGSYSGHSAFSDFQGTLTQPDRPGEPRPADLLWVVFPKFETLPKVNPALFGFSDHSFSDHAAAADQIEAAFTRYVEREVVAALRRWRASSVAVGATIEDVPQIAFYAILFDTPAGAGPLILSE